MIKQLKEKIIEIGKSITELEGRVYCEEWEHPAVKKYPHLIVRFQRETPSSLAMRFRRVDFVFQLEFLHKGKSGKIKELEDEALSIWEKFEEGVDSDPTLGGLCFDTRLDRLDFRMVKEGPDIMLFTIAVLKSSILEEG